MSLYSTTKMMHGPINIRSKIILYYQLSVLVYFLVIFIRWYVHKYFNLFYSITIQVNINPLCGQKKANCEGTNNSQLTPSYIKNIASE